MHGLILTESHHGWISGNGAMENTLADMMQRKSATICAPRQRCAAPHTLARALFNSLGAARFRGA
jgi:hypothetical protein